MLDFNPYHRRREHERTGNPLFAWDMILECRKEGRPFPDWILEYLEKTADNLIELGHEPPPKGKAPAAIRDALGFPASGKPFDEYRRFSMGQRSKQPFDFDLEVYQWIDERLAPGVTRKQLFKDAGKHFFGSDSKTGHHWRKVQKIFLQVEKALEAYRREVESLE